MIFSCCTENRRAALRANGTLKGIDYLEVMDGPSLPAGIDRQKTLLVTCINGAPDGLSPDNVLIAGGESITNIVVEWARPANDLPAQATPADTEYFPFLANASDVLVVRLGNYGDFSQYTLALVNDDEDAAEAVFAVTETLTGFDPQLASVTFSFKVDCGPEFDCAPAPDNCSTTPPTPPQINYLAKDYTSFRQTMLDRMNQLLPAWGATSKADLGIMLAEVVSYACDQLSYRQDAVTTEAYLNTARSRISLRRHARLVDYAISEGCNARAWVQLNVQAPTFLPRHGTRFYTSAPGMPASLEPGAGNEQAALDAGVVVFEPMQQALLYPELNQISFYTWGDTSCCLPKGATEATLKGSYPNLAVGDVLIFQEVTGPVTGNAADADLRHRCAVRLTAVTTTDASGNPLVDPLFDVYGNTITSGGQTAQPVTEIQWASDDALPFPVCVSATIVGSNNETTLLTDVSVVLGNVVLADHGLTMPKTTLGTVPLPSLQYAPATGADRCTNPAPNYLPVRFNPQIADSPLTQAATLAIGSSPATPDAVPLATASPVNLKDANGFITLQVSANNPEGWPSWFGVLTSAGAASGTFDLSVVFNPPGGPSGVTAPVVLESFTGMDLTPGDTNYAVTVLGNSEFLSVPSSPAPVGPAPNSFSPTPQKFPASGTMDLTDGGGTAFLTVQPTSALTWPPLFSVVSQQQIQPKSQFNLLVLYTPPSGPEGVNSPVIVEQFNNMTLATVLTAVNTASDLISVDTFEGEPNVSLSAADLMEFDATSAVPAIKVKSETPDSGNPKVDWTPVPDLLGSSEDDTQFVVEIDTDGTASLRFGDGTNGKQPEAVDVFTAVYRVGNGTAGNVGANCLGNFAAPVAARATILGCTNPLPASGGIDPETAAQIRRRAPQAFMTQARAITMQDYVNVAEQNPQIQDASAQTRWTGSWYTVFVASEPQGNAPMSKALQRSLTRTMNEYRLAGEDTYIEPPQYVPLQIALTICVDEDSFALDVKSALLQVLGSCSLPNGTPAFFSPRNFELGQSVYLSPIYAAARGVAGVTRVTATTFEPQGDSTPMFLDQGYIPMGPFQVARLDNDPSMPANGRLTLKMVGGR